MSRRIAGSTVACLLVITVSAAAQDHIVTKADCGFSADPEAYRLRASRFRKDMAERTGQAARFLTLLSSGARQSSSQPESFAVAASGIPVRNLVDEEIFAKLAQKNLPSAPLSSDETFLRRILLDLTGQTPSPNQIREFLANTNPNKRDELIGNLLFAPEFVDKWTMWLGDLLGNVQVAQNLNQNAEGRNRLHEWIRASIDSQKALSDVAYETIVAHGNNYDRDSAPANFIARGFAPMGPVEDHYDSTLARAATTYLGLSHYDCVLCHDGDPRLRSISAWATTIKRSDAQRMAAFFSRVSWTRTNLPNTDFYYQSTIVNNIANANKAYALTSTAGNRPTRITKDPNNPARNLASYMPRYRDGREPSGADWRDQFARFVIEDPMFARNLSNRLWKAMFGTALVEPVDALDPLRLDPDVPPPAPWEELQTPHTVLVNRLAGALRESHFNLREFLRLLATSSAYQLDSRYDGPWNPEVVSLFPRHYPRRIEGEEALDIISRGTGVQPRYAVTGWNEPAVAAMQLPDPLEPRSNGTVAAFLNSFQRGNRDNLPRTQAGSILMRLNMMNSAVVIDKIRMANSPTLQNIAKLGSDDAMVEELFLTFLSRFPTPEERSVATARLAGASMANARNVALEDMAWALINKVEFLFSY